MKIASYNVQNLFSRPRAMNNDTWAEGKSILEQYAEMNTILQKQSYSNSEKSRLGQLIESLDIQKSDTGKYIILRQNRGRLLKRRRDGTIEIVATGRESWIGWIELRREPMNEKAILNTAAVIRDVNADVIGIVEAENRITLKEFNDHVIKTVGGLPYKQVMLIDGNDSRGIDVGLMAKANYEIDLMRSHVHDLQDNGYPVFGRDCPEYQIITPRGNRVWVLINHLKSKGYGSTTSSNARRKLQASTIKEIYGKLLDQNEKNVIILGDLNDTPNSAALAPILEETNLKDISAHHVFDNGGYVGTYGGATESTKIDYILLSPDLFGKVRSGGVFRKGAWPGVRPKKWDVYRSITKEHHAASDHHAVWADIDI
jgi:endonuclease/exonuclease/phosphatase family metal-dependent hydrolase